ncbi:hypothetical protein KC19_1G258500 [Ceratodon purpureus]|uniref:Uncharacterized protein n=1 Tax=Ceratodon purpureus TaxID=3225 RepID=A0A8T0JBT8_CERPU|nr:hypothetical protein KC19_1G258500 [Ceratodon purpureus]
MAASEFETVEDGGFVFKVRKKRLEEIQAAPVAVEGGAVREAPVPVAEESFEVEKKKKKLLTLKAMYEAELKAWEKLEAAATAPVLEELPSNSENSVPEEDPQTDMLKELKIEVENVEEYIKRLQDHIIHAKSTYKVMMKELREDADFRPAAEIVLALTGQGDTTSDNDVIATQGSLGSSGSLNKFADID